MAHTRIMVTGGSAVAGDGLRTVVSKGEYPGHEFAFPSSRECNLLDGGAVNRYVAVWKPDAIVHFAAISGGIQLTLDHPASVMRDNVLMNFNVAEAARRNAIPKVIMTLSAAVYPVRAAVPMKEESLHEGYPHETNYSYAFAKRLTDPLMRAYAQEYGISMTGIIPGAIIGPRSSFEPAKSTAVPALIRRFCENRNGNGPLVVWGDGSPLRQFTADEDVGRIAMWFVEHETKETLFNISTPEETSIKEAAYMIAEFVGVDPARIRFDASKPAGTYRQSVDSSRFLAFSGFKHTATRDTIRRTVDYFMANYPNQERLRL